MKTTNKIQEHYILAKAQLTALEKAEKDLETKYISENKIKNPGGTTPTRIFCIENEDVFNKANEELSIITESNGLWQEILSAKEKLKKAEDELIKYGLSIAPIKQREILKKAVKENYTTRLKIIDLVFRLDVSTVK